MNKLGLVDVSEHRQRQTTKWYLERALDKVLYSEKDEVAVKRAAAAGRDPDWPAPEIWDWTPKVGDIFLLPDKIGRPYSIMPTAAITAWNYDHFAVQMFSPYEHPASQYEWDTGMGAPNKVLQCWNRGPMFPDLVKMGIPIGELSPEQVEFAEALWRHDLHGTLPPVDQREGLGLALSDPTDERYRFQSECAARTMPLWYLAMK